LVNELTLASGHDERKPLRQAIEGLGCEIAPELAKHLGHPNCFTRWEIVSLLGEFAHPDTLSTVVEFALSENEVHARWRSFWAVSRYSRTSTVPLLLRNLSSRDEDRRWRAALVLSMLGRAEAVPVLLTGLDSLDGWIQWEALSAIKSLAPANVEERVIDFLADDKALALRQEATLALAAIGSERACRALESALEDSEPQVRWRASMGLSRTRDPGRLPLLRKALAIENDTNVIEQFRQDIANLEKVNDET